MAKQKTPAKKVQKPAILIRPTVESISDPYPAMWKKRTPRQHGIEDDRGGSPNGTLEVAIRKNLPLSLNIPTSGRPIP